MVKDRGPWPVTRLLWIAGLLSAGPPSGCGSDPDTTDTVLGIQVVAIEPIPASPLVTEPLTLRTWVADGLDRGADVLVWVCTPVEGRCLEAFPPGTEGLPLSFWTRVGRADPMFESLSSWPLYVGLTGGGVRLPGPFSSGNMLIWALACAPGLCPLIDQVAIDPVAGSEAWTSAVEQLADPSRWVGELPRDQVSLAVKAIAVHLEDGGARSPEGASALIAPPEGSAIRNRSPHLHLELEDPGATVFRLSDPDGDPLSTRSFTTAGGVSQRRSGDDGLEVLWQAPLLVSREPTRFVVAEDGRGGTAVWCSALSTDPCAVPRLTLGPESRPISPGDPFELECLSGGEFGGSEICWFDLRLDLRGVRSPSRVEARLSLDGRVNAQHVGTLDPGFLDCERHGFSIQLWLDVSLGLEERCALLGRVGSLEIEVSPEGTEPISSRVEVVFTGGGSLGCQGI